MLQPMVSNQTRQSPIAAVMGVLEPAREILANGRSKLFGDVIAR
jgi:hypothetical protein